MVLMNNNTVTVACIKKQDGTISLLFCLLTQHIVTWSEPHSFSVVIGTCWAEAAGKASQRWQASISGAGAEVDGTSAAVVTSVGKKGSMTVESDAVP